MNSQHKTLILTSILAFALLANVNVGAIYATGNMDDEEEEEAIYALQDSVEEIQNSLGIIELNLSEGTNDIEETNCPTTTEEIVKEVITNITTPTENNNVTELLPPEPTPVCPFIPEQNNVTEPVVEEPPITTVIPTPVQNLTCPFVTPPVAVVEENVTEPEPICDIPQGIIPGIVLPNITEPVEPPIVQNNVTVEPEVSICNLTSSVLPPVVVVVEPNVTEIVEGPIVTNNLTDDGQEIAEIEFDVSCNCFVIDRTPVEVAPQQ